MITELQKNVVLNHLLPIKPYKIGVFGSYARGENNAQSDLDILISLNYSYPISLLRLAAIEQDLREALGLKVDLVTEGSLSPYMRPYIEKDLIYIYQ